MLSPGGGEQGATAVLLAASLAMLMGFAAVAIDIGRGFNERRLDQTTADTSALAAGVELIVSGDPQAAVDSVKNLAGSNLDNSSDWASCTDPDHLAFTSDSLGITGGSQCISFGANDAGVAFARIRVRVPDQTLDTTFGRVIGTDSITAAAAAEVQLRGSFGNSGAFPSGVMSGTGTGATTCIKTGTSPHSVPESCGSPSTGDFGNFEPYFYTELSPANPTSLCTSGLQPDPLARAMADGLDHFLGTTPTAPGSRRNGASCPSFPGPIFPDQLDPGGGYSAQDITNGLIQGGSFDGSFTGRLRRSIWGSPYGTATVLDYEVDNRPLWSYIDTGTFGPGTPASCTTAAGGPAQVGADAAEQAAYETALAALTSCLQDSSVPDSLFLSDLYQSARLVLVPVFHETSPLESNACCYNIKSFLPVFIHGVWTTFGPQWTCDGGVVSDPIAGYCKHEPGRTGNMQVEAPGQKKIDSASGIVLSCGVLPGVDPPDEKCKTITNGGGSANVFLNLYLTK